MTTPISITGYATGVTDLYAFPVGKSLADWSTYRVLFTEGTDDDTELYTATVDTANGTNWVVFEGATQPASWGGALKGLVFNLLTPVTLTPESIADLVSAGGVTSYAPVAPGGQITDPIVIGDDYLAIHGRAFAWDVPALPDVDVEDAECFFGIKNTTGDGFVVEGTVTEVSAETWRLSFDVPRTEFADLPKGGYEWSAEVRDSSGNEVTRVRNGDFNYRLQLVEKQT